MKINWDKWQTNNIKLTNNGWTLITEYMKDGSIKFYAQKGDIRISNEPDAALKD